jgi:cyclopropane-fatty-acyl-phospholipid synthase
MAATESPRALEAAKRLARAIGARVGARLSVELWDGSVIPLGADVHPSLRIRIAGPGVLGTLMRRPTPENLLRQYATGGFDIVGGDVVAFFELLREKRARTGYRSLRKRELLSAALPFLFARGGDAKMSHGYAGDEKGRSTEKRDDADYMRFHYDIGNDFYALFLDPRMVYTCAYFPHWGATLEEAQEAKLEMICRKLQLRPGDRFLDIGCGWGGLLCHAVEHFGVIGHGVSLSNEQTAFARARIAERGLEDRITLELRSYEELDTQFDKISSIGMAEAVGRAGLPAYYEKVHSLLRDRGMFLNHAITRRAKHRRRGRLRPEQRIIQKYIFPGGELDDIGHTLMGLEASGFEVQDVENWREHYARTTKLWCQRLSAQQERAVELVGRERYRLWTVYLAGVSMAFTDGSMRIYQTVATKQRAKGPSGTPPTRAHLYRD